MASTNNHGTPDPQVTPRSTGPRRYSAEYKARILAEYETLDKHGKGALLRREGLYSSLITTWRQQRDKGARTALAAPAGRPKADPKDKEIARLKAEKARLESERRSGDGHGHHRHPVRPAGRRTGSCGSGSLTATGAPCRRRGPRGCRSWH